MSKDIYKKVGNATKWSVFTEIMSKIVTPISNMALARILAPEQFGIVATITMITSFAMIFSDAGFQKYIIQHEFESQDQKYQIATVAFWANLGVSVLIWGLISLNSSILAEAVGAKGYENAIIIASLIIIISAFSSIQMAIYKSEFDFRTLFIVKSVLIVVPFVVTIPLAFVMRTYWALIIGNLAMNLINAVVLTVKSKWKITFFFNFQMLKEIVSFSFWTLIDNILNWFTSWGDTFIVGVVLSSYYVGIYKTSINTVNSIIDIVTGATTHVLLTALSRLQNDHFDFEKMLIKYQHLVSMLLFPMGAGIFLYRGLVTEVLLGSQWSEATFMIGIWGLMSALAIPFNTYGSIVCIAKGKPKLSVLAQIAQLVVLFPVIYLSSSHSFSALCIARTVVRFEGIAVFMLIMKFAFSLSLSRMFKGLIVPFICTLGMAIAANLMQLISSNMIFSFASIFVCAIIYFVLLCLFPNERKEVIDVLVTLKNKLNK